MTLEYQIRKNFASLQVRTWICYNLYNLQLVLILTISS